MTWGGTKEPTAFAQLCNLGNHNPESTQRYTEVLSKFLVDKLGVSQQRQVIIISHGEMLTIVFEYTLRIIKTAQPQDFDGFYCMCLKMTAMFSD